MERASGVSAVVLAAGMSRRMGTPKQLLRIEGQTVLELTLGNVRSSQVDEIVLVLGFAAEAVEKETPISNVNVVRNADYEQGMGTSLRSGLAAVNQAASAAIIVLADQPFVQPATLNKLMECHRGRRAQIVIPTFRGFRGNPVLLDRSVFAELRSLSGDVGCRAIFGNHTEDIYKLPVDDPGILLDIDSRDDFMALTNTGKESGIAAPPLVASSLEGDESADTERPELVVVGR